MTAYIANIPYATTIKRVRKIAPVVEYLPSGGSAVNPKTLSIAREIRVIHSPITKAQYNLLVQYYESNRDNDIELVANDGTTHNCKFTSDGYELKPLKGTFFQASTNFISSDPTTANAIFDWELTTHPSDAGKLNVTWTAPQTNGATITGYDIEVIPVSSSGWGGATSSTALSSASSLTVTGLSSSTYYRGRIRAKTSLGDSPWSPVLRALVGGVPLAVTEATTSSTASSISIAWTMPDQPIPLTGQKVQYKISSGSTWTDVSTTLQARTASVTSGLSSNTAYNMRVVVTNSYGSTNSANFNVSTNQSISAPAAPTVTITTSTNTISLSWAAVTGATAYRVQWKIGANGTVTSIARTTSQRTYSITTSGSQTYYTRVAAINTGGTTWSSWAQTSSQALAGSSSNPFTIDLTSASIWTNGGSGNNQYCYYKFSTSGNLSSTSGTQREWWYEITLPTDNTLNRSIGVRLGSGTGNPYDFLTSTLRSAYTITASSTAGFLIPSSYRTSGWRYFCAEQRQLSLGEAVFDRNKFEFWRTSNSNSQNKIKIKVEVTAAQKSSLQSATSFIYFLAPGSRNTLARQISNLSISTSVPSDITASSYSANAVVLDFGNNPPTTTGSWNKPTDSSSNPSGYYIGVMSIDSSGYRYVVRIDTGSHNWSLPSNWATSFSSNNNTLQTEAVNSTNSIISGSATEFAAGTKYWIIATSDSNFYTVI